MSDHHADFEPIHALLEQQLAQYTKLLALAEEMRECMINLNVETLEKLVRAQTVQLRQIEALEKKRLSATEALYAALKLSGPRTLTELIPYAAGAEQAELQKLRDAFAELIPQLTAANAANKALLQTNMDLNEMMLNLITDPEDPLNNFYGSDGSESEGKISSPSIFDQQI